MFVAAIPIGTHGPIRVLAAFVSRSLDRLALPRNGFSASAIQAGAGVSS